MRRSYDGKRGHASGGSKIVNVAGQSIRVFEIYAGMHEKLRPYLEDVGDIRQLKRGEFLYIGRGSPWGNPFRMTAEQDRDHVVLRYLNWLEQMIADSPAQSWITWLTPVAEALQKGQKLGCYCYPRLCHGMVLAAFVRQRPEFAHIFEDKPPESPTEGPKDGR